MKHTPEPWVIYGHGIDGPLDEFGSKQIVVYQVERKEDARRIVACVNALAGIPTHFLEESASDAMSLEVARANARSLKVKLFKAERQRDQLLAALKAAMRFIDSHVADPDITPEMTAVWLDLLKINPANLIAAVEGGNKS